VSDFAQNAFLIYAGFSASNGGHFPVYSTTFLPFFERKFDAYLRQICLFDAYLRRSGGFMCQMTMVAAMLHNLSTLLVLGNAGRLLQFHETLPRLDTASPESTHHV
jgi:hypothetical protein